MSKRAVIELKDEIIALLREGHSIREVERLLRDKGLRGSDIQRYFNEVTGLDYHDIMSQAKPKTNTLPVISQEEIKRARERRKETEGISISLEGVKEQIKALQRRIDVLEEEIEELKTKEQKIQKPKRTKKALIELRGYYKSKDKSIYSIRLINELKPKMKKKADELGINLNELINFAIIYFLD